MVLFLCSFLSSQASLLPPKASRIPPTARAPARSTKASRLIWGSMVQRLNMARAPVAMNSAVRMMRASVWASSLVFFSRNVRVGHFLLIKYADFNYILLYRKYSADVVYDSEM